MKILVLPVSLHIGGSEINAVESAAAVQALGHEVIVAGRPGPMGERARGLGLRVIELPGSGRGRPNPSGARAIARIVEAERPDLVHAYEAAACTEAFFAAAVRHRVPVLHTLYAMNVEPFLPRTVPTIAGTADIERALLPGRDPRMVFRLEPPVDTDANSPDEADGLRQRQLWGVRDDEELVVIASRLDVWMKIDSLVDTMDAVDLLAAERPIRLVLVGDGPARPALEHKAEAINARHGRPVVRLVGAMVDPVPAYRAADVVVGMGTSILRAMAVGRPALLAGELGYVQPIAPDTVAPLLEQGFWGVGDGSRSAGRLAELMRTAIDLDPQDRAELGRWSRDLIEEGFGLRRSTRRLLEIYDLVLRWTPAPAQVRADVARVPVSVLVSKVRGRLPGRRSGLRALSDPSRLDSGYQSAQAWIPSSRPAGGEQPGGSL